ncbi:uncharacterized protein EDB91DRAFT_1083818 [Suillus paluster]|uniref:uncharacterized protein n=1 Tax=Suillus paluster TaxID=48578 RepID=UPI001B876099|nr:uncharacterized protein EDB91DRAFT_1083818 [Suillus paluster]KAG1735074.1 hypothetical protein EDB91DRAFT_1083818 [Suillus paluster]
MEATPDTTTPSTNETSLGLDDQESTPPPVVVAKKQGCPQKQSATSTATETAVETHSELKKPPGITYYLTMFSDAQMQKPQKQRKSVNTFMVQSSDIKYDTLKAQILAKISENLKPKITAFKNYTIAWTIPQTQASSIPLSSAADYQFLLRLAVKQKTLLVNFVIETHLMKNKVHGRLVRNQRRQMRIQENDHEDASQDGGSKNSESEDEDDRPKKKAKSGKKSKSIIETPLNLKINAKIRLLQNRWMCSKASCSSNHCFIHPEHSEHFSPGHEHFSIWAAAWNKDKKLADLETSPNHHKFNTAPGRKTANISPLLQHRLADHNQPTNNAGPVINFNIPPELLAVFHPAPAQPVIEHGIPPAAHDPQSLVQSGWQHGPTLLSMVLQCCMGLKLKEMGFKYGEIAARSSP